MNKILLDPTGERGAAQREPLERPASLDGLTIGLLDISKTKGDVYLDRLDHHFKERGLVTKRFKKPTFTRPAPVSLLQEIASQCDVVVEGLAD
jgi:hypothetical protein